jgi:hypothetical protein
MESFASAATEFVKSAADNAYAAAAGAGEQIPLQDPSKASKLAEQAVSSASEAVAGTPSSLTDSLTDAISSATESAASVSSKTLGPKAASILAAGKARKDEAFKQASAAVSEASAATSIPSASPESDNLKDTLVDSSSASSLGSEAAETASSAGSKVLGGAHAQVLAEAREPILDTDIVDDDDTYSAKLQAIYSAAGDQASKLTQAVQDAIRPTPTSQGTMESISSVASSQYASAVEAANSILFGSPAAQQTLGAKELYESAVTAASHAIYGTPIATAATAALSSYYASISSLAASQLSQGLSAASAQYESAKIAVGVTPTPVHQQYLDAAQAAYYQGIGVAHDR